MAAKGLSGHVYRNHGMDAEKESNDMSLSMLVCDQVVL